MRSSPSSLQSPPESRWHPAMAGHAQRTRASAEVEIVAELS
jgi:hypothetical protein